MEFLMNFGALSGKILVPLVVVVFVMYLVGMLLVAVCGSCINSYVRKAVYKRTMFNGFSFLVSSVLIIIANLAILLSKIGFVASFIFLAFYLISLAI